jgi:hypothetical protein
VLHDQPVPQRLVFWPDSSGGPLWDEAGEQLPLAALPVADDVRDRAQAWVAQYDDGRLPIDRPGDVVWLEEGRGVLSELRQALGGGYDVVVTEPWWGEEPVGDGSAGELPYWHPISRLPSQKVVRVLGIGPPEWVLSAGLLVSSAALLLVALFLVWSSALVALLAIVLLLVGVPLVFVGATAVARAEGQSVPRSIWRGIHGMFSVLCSLP